MLTTDFYMLKEEVEEKAIGKVKELIVEMQTTMKIVSL